MKRLLILLTLNVTIISVHAQPRESLSDKIRRAYSLVGRWEITKMVVDRSGTLTNPSNVPETAMGGVTVLLRSDLGEFGHFDVAPGGSITGTGKVLYQFNVSAGTSSFSWGPVNLPIGAAASMYQDNGVRSFTITGSADLSARTIMLNVFQAQGADLKMIIRPGGKTFTSVIWPPMTKISETKVMVHGSSMLLRASGVLQGIKLEFEAVKYVDLAGLFTDIEQYIDERVTNIVNRAGGNTTNNTNNNTTSNTTNTTENNNAGGTGIVAGNVLVPSGEGATVIFRTPRLNTNYAISLTAVNVAGQTPVLTYSNKTINGFRVLASGQPGREIKVEWMVTPYSQ